MSERSLIPTQINIAPRGKSWQGGRIVDGEHGYKSREEMEKAEGAINVSDVEAFAMGELSRAAKEEGASRELKTEWAFGIALMLRKLGHREAAERIEAERAKVFSWAEHIDTARAAY